MSSADSDTEESNESRWEDGAAHVHDFIRNMQQERLIDICLRDETVPIKVFEQFLRRASPWFEAALANPRRTTGNVSTNISSAGFLEGQTGTLRFPDDYKWALSSYFYWLLNGKLGDYPRLDNLGLVKAWVLGDEYGLADFQDDVMYAIWLFIVEAPDYFAWPAVKHAFRYRLPGSLLRKCVATSAMWADNNPSSWPGLLTEADFVDVTDRHGDALEWSMRVYTHFTAPPPTDFLDAIDAIMGHDPGSNGNPVWMRFMVHHGPKQARDVHWNQTEKRWRVECDEHHDTDSV